MPEPLYDAPDDLDAEIEASRLRTEAIFKKLRADVTAAVTERQRRYRERLIARNSAGQ